MYHKFKKCNFLFLLLLIFLSAISINALYGQYFGRNKVRYQTFDFHVLETPHFLIYNYLDNESLKERLVDQSEMWYRLHREVLKDTIGFKNPLILYNNHADFQQTTVIGGLIGVGTGGVTEGMRNRVVMPLVESNAQNNHVLGHELVHAFQYNMMRTGDSTSLSSIGNIPLWMVEGLAEYLSVGRVDAHTAMWMRDAVRTNDIPTVKDLNDYAQYFPYRYGQAFWAFVAGTWGDRIIRPLFMNTAKYGVEAAIDTTLGMSRETLSELWKNSLTESYGRFMEDSIENTKGIKVISEDNGGEVNVSPVLSPNGEYMAFLSEKDIFTIDLFIADAKTGKVLQKISSFNRDAHINALNYTGLSGSWAPDNQHIAFSAFKKGKNYLTIADALNGKIKRSIKLPGLPFFNHLSWSPDGDKLVISGLVEGQNDLYLYNLEKDSLIQLTNDIYSELHPNWSPDSRYIVFSTDRLSMQDSDKGKLDYNLALIDAETGAVQDIRIFRGADNLNPVFTPDGESIVFLSNRDGFRNAYRYYLDNRRVEQVTDFFTGISGITELSPAISVAGDEAFAYAHYSAGKYTIYRAPLSTFTSTEVDPDEVDFTAATLPPLRVTTMVSRNLEKINRSLRFPPDSVKKRPYLPKFGLTYIGNTTVGISTSSFGTGVAGGVNMLFSDIMENNRLFVGVALNGEIQDIAGQVAYLNQKYRLSWGGSVSHIPYRSESLDFTVDTISLNGNRMVVNNIVLNRLRIFEDRISAFTFYPISQNHRLELSGSFARYSYSFQQINNYYSGGVKVDEERENLPAPDGFNLYNGSVAFVGDRSFFGPVSPLKGSRCRYEVGGNFGEYNYYNVLLDYRKYYFIKPFSIGYRLFHYSRLGPDAVSGILSPIYLGFPGFIHGYNNVRFSGEQEVFEDDFTINDLFGTRIAVANVEFRIPFSGPERLALLSSRMFFTELALFFDGGIAWTGGNRNIEFGSDILQTSLNRQPVFSAGVAFRINFFSQLVLEPFYAFPFQRTDVQYGVFGINFVPPF